MNLTNCPVIVYDDKNTLIAKSIISEHYISDMIIRISNELREVQEGDRINLMVIHPASAITYSGTARRIRASMREVTLFNERQREARASLRHNLDSPAIAKILKDGTPQSAENPVPVVVANISTTGAFIKSPVGSFEMGSKVEIDINIQDRRVLLYGTILRAVRNSDGSRSYGCKFFFPK